MKVVVINLFNARQRASVVSSALNKQSIPHTYFHGLDNNQFALRSQDPNHEKGLIGCFISHLLAWQNNRRSPETYVVFLEDDYVIPEDFKYKVEQAIEDLPLDADCAHLIWFPMGNGAEYQPVNSTWQKARGVWSTAALLIKTSSIQKLTDNLRTVEGHLDIVLYNKGWEGKLNVYYLNKPIGSLAGLKSQIKGT